MAVFGFLVLLGFSAWVTFMVLFCLSFGGEEFSSSKIKYWILCVPLLIWGWYEVVKLSPFTVQVTG